MNCKATLLLISLNIVLLTFTASSTNNVPCPPKSTPVASPSGPEKQAAKCPKDTLKFGVCGDWLGLVHEVIGTKPSSQCCALLTGFADLEAAACLCTAIQGKILGTNNLQVPLALSLILNSCGKRVPKSFLCA